MEATNPVSYQHAAMAFVAARLKAHLSIRVYELGSAWKLDANGSMVAATPPYITFDLRPQPDRQHKAGTAFTRFDATIRAVAKPETGSPAGTAEYVTAIEDALGMAAGFSQGLRVQSRRTASFSAPPYAMEGENVLTREDGLRCDVKVYGG